MEEHSNQVSRTFQEAKSCAEAICKEAAQELLKKKNQMASKSFFVSIAHHFLERLIHLHNSEIKQLLNSLSKEFQAHLQGGLQEGKNDLSWQQLFNIKQSRQENYDVFNTIRQLFRHLLGIECKGRSNFQRQNIFLEISCSLNYTCPLCIKKIDQFSPKSIKLIKHTSEQMDSVRQPITMKVISCVEADRAARLPSFSKPNKFESILQIMKAERQAAKKQEENKQKKQNKVWTLLGHLLDLDREKYTIDHIFKESKDRQNNLMKELNQKNIKNQHYIAQFSRKMKSHHYQLKENNVKEEYFENYHPPHQSVQKASSEKRSISSKHRKNTVLKKQVKILVPICNNSSRLSSLQPSMNMIQRKNEVSKCNYSYLTQRPTQNDRKMTKTMHLYRPFKSNRDVCSVLSQQKCEGFDLNDQSFSKSFKLI